MTQLGTDLYVKLTAGPTSVISGTVWTHGVALCRGLRTALVDGLRGPSNVCPYYTPPPERAPMAIHKTVLGQRLDLIGTPPRTVCHAVYDYPYGRLRVQLQDRLRWVLNSLVELTARSVRR